MQSVYFTGKKGSLVTGNLVHNRINFRWNMSEHISLRAETRNRLFYGEQVKITYGFGKYIDTDKGSVDLSCNIVDETAVVFNVMLDRLLLNWSDKKWDITLGRQRINWGVNLVWNPNDIFNAFNYFDFDYQERPGADALRIQYNTGRLSSWELAYKLSGNEKEQVGAFMYKTNLKGYDLQGFAGIFYEDVVVGTGWAGNIKNSGFKGELSYFHPNKKTWDTSGVVVASVSFDRSFKNDYFAMASYLYNNNNTGYQGGVNSFTDVTLSANRLMPFRHSFFAQVSKNLSPLLNGSFASVFSPENNTLILLPSFALSVSTNWDISLVGQFFFNSMNGGYHTLGNAIYFRLQWSY